MIGGIDMKDKYIAFKCLECGMINVYPNTIRDGNNCIKCNGYITAIGEARLYKKSKPSITVDINVNQEPLLEVIDMVDGLIRKINTIGQHIPPMA